MTAQRRTHIEGLSIKLKGLTSTLHAAARYTAQTLVLILLTSLCGISLCGCSTTDFSRGLSGLNYVTTEDELLPNQILNALRINFNFNSFLTRKGLPTYLRRTARGELKLYYPSGAYLVKSRNHNLTNHDSLIITGPHPLEPDIALSMRHSVGEINQESTKHVLAHAQTQLANYLALPSSDSPKKRGKKRRGKAVNRKRKSTKDIRKNKADRVITVIQSPQDGKTDAKKEKMTKPGTTAINHQNQELTSDQKALKKLANTH